MALPIQHVSSSDQLPEQMDWGTQHLFLTAPETAKSKVKVPAGLVSREDPLPALHTAGPLLHAHLVGERDRLCISFPVCVGSIRTP